MLGYVLLIACVAGAASLLTWSIADPSFMRATSGPTRNALGLIGANFSDLVMRLFGLAGVFIILPPAFWSLQLITRRRLDGARMKLTLACVAVLLLACAASSLPTIAAWPLANGLGGLLGDQALRLASGLLASVGPGRATPAAGVLCLAGGMLLLMASLGMSPGDVRLICQARRQARFQFIARTWRRLQTAFDRYVPAPRVRREPMLGMPSFARGRPTASRMEPRFDWEPQTAPAPFPVISNAELSVPRSASDGEFDGVTDRTCHAMAQRFAPDLDPPRSASWPLSHQAAGRKHAADAGARVEGASYRSAGTLAGASKLSQSSSAAGRAKPIWPGSVPALVASAARNTPATGRRPGGDKLYGRAVAIVRADPKASADHLQERLGIGYTRAADLIERMVQEGILGAPVRDGVRPVLGRGRPSRVV